MKKLAAVTIMMLLATACGPSEKQKRAPGGSRDISIATAFTPNPPRKGRETIAVTLTDSTGTPVKGATVRIESAMPSMSMSGPAATAKDNGDGTYTSRISLQYNTKWQFAISAKKGGQSGSTRVSTDVK